MFSKIKLGVATLALSLSFSAAHAVNVSLELMLLTDVSGSVSGTDYNLMREGYAQAFESAAVQQKIMDSSTGSIAVAVGQFSDSYHGITAGWTLINDAASANNFAATLRAMGRAGSGGTNIVSGINGANAAFTNAYTGERTVIDLAGDGAQSVGCSSFANICGPLQTARDNALAGQTDTINALFINDRTFFGNSGQTVNSIAYGQNNVIGGAGAFVTAVSGFSDFAAAIESKIIREIAPQIPVPAGLPLLVTALAGFGLLKRRRKS